VSSISYGGLSQKVFTTIPPEPPVANFAFAERRAVGKGAPEGAAKRTLAGEHRSATSPIETAGS
jgi:hypothetical protein